MAMTYTSLTAAKGVSGSIANWVNYQKLDIPVIVDEAQALIYSALRAREMMSLYSFNVPVGGSMVALPTGFLDPIGRMYAPSVNLTVAHKDSEFVLQNRNYTETTGSFGNNPFTTTSGQTTFSVNLAGHGFNQESEINISGSTNANGINFNGTFFINSITDTNNFVIDTVTQTATASGVDGGASAAYLCDNLVAAFANWWAIWSENIHFDTAFVQAMNLQLQYYRSLPLLSSNNTTNFLTNRYPHLMRSACVTAAAEFMKDDPEYQKCMAKLQGLITQINIENDMQYRGLELDTETP